MEIRKIQMEDANNYLDMLLNLDNETKFMMFEPGERPTDINIIKNIIEKSINGDNLILIAIDEENIVGFLSAQKENIKQLSILATLLLEYVRNTEVRELEVNYFLN